MTQTAFLNSSKVKLSASFNRSTNLELDYKSGKKISDIFITNKFSQGIEDVLGTVVELNSNQRVRVLSGSPGLGKSTFALLMATLVSKRSPKALKKLLATSDKKVISLFDEFQKSKKTKLLPVFLNGYIGNIEDAFLDKLFDAFESVDLEKDLQKAIKDSSKKYWSIVKNWQEKYPEVHAKYMSELETEVEDVKVFEEALKRGRGHAKEVFSRIHKKVTGGSNLTASSHTDVIEIYKKANEILADNGYAGLFVVYDEFGKYLEKGIHSPSALNIQFLQDFAEFCDRSGERQCHLTLITHLSVSQYATQLPINIQKEWAKIEGRFHETSFYDRGTSNYDMIGHVFEESVYETDAKLASKIEKFNKGFFKNIKGKGLIGFADIDNVETLATKCYPLHPVTLAFLPSLSQRVAQNERTLFTFLTRDEEFSLRRFLGHVSEDEIDFLLPLDLYNYFSPLIAKDVGIGGSYKTNLIIEEAFGKLPVEDELSRQIVALIGLSSIIKNFNFAPLNKDFIVSSFDGLYGKKEVEESLKALSNLKILFFNRVLKQYELQQGSSIDIDEEINKFREVKLTSKDLVRILKSYYKNDFLVPKRYNFQNKITRFYKTQLLSVEELKNPKVMKSPDYYREDGMAYYVIPFDQDELEVAKKLVAEYRHDMVAFILPKSFIECKRDIEELNAINSLYGNKEVLNSGPLVKKELDRHQEITLNAITALLNPLIGKFDVEAEVVYSKAGIRKTVQNHSQMLITLGHIFEAEFSEYIPFNNEMINKQKVSGNISLARKQIIDSLEANPMDELLGMEGNGPEVSIFKSFKKMSGLKFDILGGRLKVSKNKPFNKLLNSYRTLLQDHPKGMSAEKLLDTLVSPPFGFRKNVIPLYLAMMDKLLDHPVNHYFDGQYVPVPDGSHYDLLLKHPKNCNVKYAEISESRFKYLKAVSEVFGDSGAQPTVSSVIELLFKWKRSIPDYTKNSGKVTVEEKRLLVLLESAKEPDTLLFKDIPEAFGQEEIHGDTSKKDIESLQNALFEAKDHIFKVYPQLVKDLQTKIIKSLQRLQRDCLGEEPFEYKKGMNLAQEYQKTLNSMSEDVRVYPFNKLTAKFVNRINTFDSSKHQQYFIETMGDVLTESNPRNWAQKGASLFETNLNKCLNEIEMVTELLDSSFKGQSVIAFINKEKGEKEYLRLGLYSEVSEEGIAEKIEDLLAPLDTKSRNNLLISLLKNSEASNGKVDNKPIKGKYLE